MYVTSNSKLIDEVEIDKEAKYTIWVNGNRRAKTTGLCKYHDTWYEAKMHLMKRATERLERATEEYEAAISYKFNVEELEQ
jgi:hypothetical protein